MPDYIVALHAALWRIPAGHEHAERRDLLREQLFRAYRWHTNAAFRREVDALRAAGGDIYDLTSSWSLSLERQAAIR